MPFIKQVKKVGKTTVKITKGVAKDVTKHFSYAERMKRLKRQEQLAKQTTRTRKAMGKHVTGPRVNHPFGMSAGFEDFGYGTKTKIAPAKVKKRKVKKRKGKRRKVTRRVVTYEY